MEENFQTFLCKVESVLNGRPLTSIRDDTFEFEVLTPNHLLIRKASPNQSSANFREHEISLRWKWRSLQPAVEMFWRIWVKACDQSISFIITITRSSSLNLRADLVTFTEEILFKKIFIFCEV